MEAEKLTELQESITALENRIELLEIIAKKAATEEIQPEAQQVKKTRIIQINTVPPPNKLDGKGNLVGPRNVGRGPYFCTTSEQARIFAENNPGVKTESFPVELSPAEADKRLNNPENKKQFTRRS